MDTVATVNFDYSSFTFKIWNHFSNFTNNNEIVFRASIYDPNNYMPS